MKRRVLLSSVTGSMILAAAAMLPSTAAFAADQMPVKAASVADTWWSYHGDIEFGGRFFANNPQKDGLASQNEKALGKYYEYNDIKPGAFLNGWLSTGSKNGLYKIDLWANNVGYDDQRIELGASKAGEHYFNFMWDETPHVRSTNALTLYNGLGTNSLTLPAGLASTLYTNCNPGAPSTTCTNPATAQANINNNLRQTDIGIRRDTAAVDYRWTPNSNWDVQVAYSHMHRTGSQVEGVVFGPNTGNVGAAQVPKPVNDTTQNYAATGEYAGTSPWGKKFNLKVGYAGSTYTDKWNSYTVEDPFCSAANTGAAGSQPGLCGPTSANGGNMYAPSALMSLWPSNKADGFNATLGADLPAKSRYMGTVSYTMMRQNEAFLPFTNNATPYLNGNPSPTLPASSLNGAINTLLVNNVLTTDITSTLKSKLSYRYYDFSNNTPELLFNDWILTDTVSANNRNAGFAPARNISTAYTKQNAGADLNWGPDRHWNLGVGYGFERYSWTRADVDATNEHSGKVFVDYKPWGWLTQRASFMISDRRYNNYDYRGNVGTFQWPDPLCQVTATPCGPQYNARMRQFYLDNRLRNKVNYSLAVDVVRGLTVTPNFGYQEDNYSISSTEVGLVRSQMIKSGVELAYAFNPWTTFLVSYMNEQYRQNFKYATGSGALTATNVFHADVRDNVNTLMGAVKWAAIPEKLDFSFAYTMSLSNNSQPQNRDDGATPANLQYPDVKGQWSRFEALAKYTFDKERVRAMGFNGEIYAKLRYIWERNSVDNFDQDIMIPYFNTLGTSTSLQRMTWMAFNNPNYNVHLIGASLGLKW